MRRVVYTVTLNPSIDVTIWTDGLDDDAVNHVLDERREAGGKGINVSRVLNDFGVDTVCLALAGGENRVEFSRFLQEDNLRFELLETRGAVRENITLRHADTTVKINRQGQPLSRILLGALMALLRARVHNNDIVVFAGSLPENMQIQDYIELILSVKSLGALVVVDNDCLTLDDYRRITPWLIKPNIHELQRIMGQTLTTDDEILKAVKSLQALGIHNVLCTLGARGMVLVSANGVYRANAPQVQVKSTVGAGDSSLGGFIVGTVKNYTPAECVRMASACGVSCATQDGTAVATKSGAAQWADQITVETL